jgi:hypothetical protein
MSSGQVTHKAGPKSARSHQPDEPPARRARVANSRLAARWLSTGRGYRAEFEGAEEDKAG